MTQHELIEYAIKGLTADITELEKTVIKGNHILANRNKQIDTDTSPMTYNEILDVVVKKREEMDKLDKKRSELEWQLI